MMSNAPVPGSTSHQTATATLASGSSERGEFELRELVAILRRHALVLALTTLVVAAITAFWVLRQPDEYRASTVIRIVDSRRVLTSGIESAGLDRLTGPGFDILQSQIHIIRSRGVIGAVVDAEGLRLRSVNAGFPRTLLADIRVSPTAPVDTIQVRFDADGFRVLGNGNLMPYGSTVELDGVNFRILERPPVEEVELAVIDRVQAIRGVLANLRTQPRPRSDIIDIEYTARNPVTAQRVANAVADAFAAANAGAAQQQSRLRRIFLEEQLVQTDSMLLDAQVALVEFRGREQVYSAREKFAAQQTGLMNLEIRREELESDRRMLQRLLTQVERGDAQQQRIAIRALVSYPGLGDNPAIHELSRQLISAEAAVDTLTAGAWGRAQASPDVGRAREIVDATQRNLIAAIRSHVEGLSARVAGLDELLARSSAEIRMLPETESEEVLLVQQLETVRSIADRIRDEYQRARVAEAVEIGQVEVVDYAILPTEPEGGRRSAKIMMGLILGFALGVGGAFLRENLNTAIRRKDEIESVLRVPDLGVVPRVTHDLGPASNRLSHIRPAWFGLKGTRNGRNGDMDPTHSLVSISHIRSTGAESFRTLRTNLLFSRAVHNIHSIVVTSASPSEGKSTIAANLAITFAQRGMKVLLVDADMRRPRMQALFGIPREPGLSQVLAGQIEAASAIRGSSVENLFLLPAGLVPPNPSELIGSARMDDFIRSVQERFDMVVVDTPPLLAAADSAQLATMTDGAVLVVRAGGTERGAARQAVAQLHSVGARILGAVLNDPDGVMSIYGRGYSGYYSYDYYGAEPDTPTETISSK